MKTTQTEEVNGSSGGGAAENEWEMRPGGMLVQKRNPHSDRSRLPPPPAFRLRVKYGSATHEIYINSQATFGELKRMLSGPTGLHHEDQKLLFKEKERDSTTFLDVVGVKDRSKIVLVQDPVSQEKRYFEMRKTAKMNKDAKLISAIGLEIDRLVGQVSELESVIAKGGKVVVKQVSTLTELLMNQLLKLDGIIADGDVKIQRGMQVVRVQKCVETLDILKAKYSMLSSNGIHITPVQQQQQSSLQKHQQQIFSDGRISFPTQQPQLRHSIEQLPLQKLQQPARHSASGSVPITTKWETFDVFPASLPLPPATSNNKSHTNTPSHPNFVWDLL